MVKTKCKLSTNGYAKGLEYSYEFVGKKYRVYKDNTKAHYRDFKYKDFIIYFL